MDLVWIDSGVIMEVDDIKAKYTMAVWLAGCVYHIFTTTIHTTVMNFVGILREFFWMARFSHFFSTYCVLKNIYDIQLMRVLFYYICEGWLFVFPFFRKWTLLSMDFYFLNILKYISFSDQFNTSNVLSKINYTDL